MKKIVLTAAAFVAVAAPAFAADLPQRQYTKAPPVVAIPIYDWTGFYIGGNAGWGESRNCWGLQGSLSTLSVADGCLSRSGGLVGGQMGYRWQAASWVFGLEAQGDWANFNGQHISPFNPLVTTGVKVDGLGLFTGQIGYAWNAALLYLKGGAAVTSNQAYVNSTFGGAVGIFTLDSTRWGGTVGVGFEYGFTPNWTMGVEYDHLFMGDSNNSFSVPSPLVAYGLNRISQDVDMVTFRLNYKFGGVGKSPVVARY